MIQGLSRRYIDSGFLLKIRGFTTALSASKVPVLRVRRGQGRLVREEQGLRLPFYRQEGEGCGEAVGRQSSVEAAIKARWTLVGGNCERGGEEVRECAPAH
jgi:hypothetical protein